MTDAENKTFQIIFDEYGLTPGELAVPNREAYVSEARFLAIHFLRVQGATLQHIGELLNRTHASIIHALRTVENWIETDKRIASMVTRISQLIADNDR